MICSILLILAAAVAPATEEATIRNPFWPLGFEGQRHSITLSPRGADGLPARAQNTRVRTARPGGNTLWDDARMTLSINNICIYDKDGFSRQLVQINGRPYANGDLISINHEGYRFTWQVLGVGTNGVTGLRRMHWRPLAGEKLSKQEKEDR